MKPVTKTILGLSIFSIAMGYLETAVVVYLRALYYPTGFTFPLPPITPAIAITEFWREVATLIMLAGIGIIAGKNASQRFAFFIYCFAIWDIFYYVFLKALLNWPESLATWDILFLIPIPWVGPVIAPCIVAFTMIILALIIVYKPALNNDGIYLQFIDYMILLLGSSILLLSFIWDYIMYLSQHAKPIWTIKSNAALFAEVSNYIPNTFNWWLFGLGELVLLFEIALLINRYKLKIIPLTTH